MEDWLAWEEPKVRCSNTCNYKKNYDWCCVCCPRTKCIYRCGSDPEECNEAYYDDEDGYDDRDAATLAPARPALFD